MDELNYDLLRASVGGGAVGLRARTPLEPAGGPGDKIFPPTYAADGNRTRYPLEERRRDGEVVLSVVLDSVAARANALEEGLLAAARVNDAPVPLVSVDFTVDESSRHLGVISSLEAPHRIFDALLRDSLDGDLLFRLGDTGRAVTQATADDAAALLHWAPTTLLFGGWDSTGPRGGLGSKYERAITSEVTAFGVTLGMKTASRLDPAGIAKDAGPVYVDADGEGWTLEEAEARREKGKPVLFGKGGNKGRPSLLNHGNVTPSMDANAGGVTADHIEVVTVLSFAALRRLRFPRTAAGQAVESRVDAEVAARTALAALGVTAAVLAHEEGYDLRSRCVLFATEPLTFELLVSGEAPQRLVVHRDAALALLRTAVERLRETGLTWAEEELLLTPAPRLVDLVRRSREVIASQAPDEAG